MVLTPKLGVALERLDKKKVIVISDYLSALVFGLMALLQFLNLHHDFLFGSMAAAYLIIGSAFSISSSVLFTQLTDDHNRLKVNGFKGLLENLASLGTPAVGTLLFAFIGLRGILVLNLVIFFASATLELFIQIPALKDQNGPERAMGLRDYREVFQWLKMNWGILGLLLIAMILNFFVAPNEEVIFVGILIDQYGVPTSYYGFSTTVFVLGSLCASFLILRASQLKKLKLSKLFILNSFLLVVMGLLAIALRPLGNWKLYYALFLFLIFFVGAVTTLINVPLISRFQSHVPVQIQSRFFATLSLGSSILIPLGIFVSGAVCNRIGGGLTLLLFNLIVIVLVLLIRPDSDRTKKKLNSRL